MVMKHLIIFLLIVCFAWPVQIAGQTSTSFEGSWRLNRNRSEDLTGGLAGADYGIEVTQTATELTVEEQVTIRGRLQPTQPRTYRLDGTETTTEVSRPIAGTLELQARPLAKGRQLELKSTISGDNQGEPLTLITREFWELLDNNRTLRITRTRELGEKTTQMVLVFERR